MISKEVKVDCHVHSQFSPDSRASLLGIETAGQRSGLDAIAITDHNTIAETARYLRDSNGLFILGEEILTSDRNNSGQKIEIVGLFLQETIDPGQTLSETIAFINDQEGIVIIPHPFEEWRHGAGDQGSRDIISQCLSRKIPVAVEIYNARAGLAKFNSRARRLWQEFRQKGVLATAGSDAHRIAEIGRACVIIPPFRTKEEFIEALRQARIYGQVNALGTAYHRLMNRIEMRMGFSFP